MINLVFGLHLYQPPNQDSEILEKITKESYLPVIELALSHPKAFFTVDLAKSAIELLKKQNSGKDFLKKVVAAEKLQKIFLANIAAYHPILPLIPDEEIKRQILLNEKSYKKLFGEFFQKPDGLFPPEMAYSQKIVPVLQKLGYRWTIAGDTPFFCHYKTNPPFNWIPKQGETAVFLRSGLWSNRIAFEAVCGKTFAGNLKNDLGEWFGKQRGYLIIWLDWETFGHHRKGLVESFLAPFLDNLDPKIKLVSPSDLLSIYPKREIFVPPGTWSTSAEDFGRGNYWPLWKNPDVEFHRLWWELAELTLEIKKVVAGKKQLSLFDKALYSCQTWQYSMGNKNLAIKGMEYFKEIMELEEVWVFRPKMAQIIQRMEEICK